MNLIKYYEKVCNSNKISCMSHKKVKSQNFAM